MKLGVKSTEPCSNAVVNLDVDNIKACRLFTLIKTGITAISIAGYLKQTIYNPLITINK